MTQPVRTPTSLSLGSVCGNWTILDASPIEKPRHLKYWRCRCACGSEVYVYQSELIRKTGGGCRLCTIPHKSRLTHGMTGTTEFRIWNSMLTRCGNPNSINYRWYGAMGITVCDKWKSSFPAFLQDMGLRPSPKHTLDRKHNSIGYEPENCRWATRLEQANNKSNSVFVELNGRVLTATQWSRELAIPVETLCSRARKGWPAERVLSMRKYVNQFDHDVEVPK